MIVTAYKKQRGGLMTKSLSLALLIILCLMPLSIEAETGKEQLELARMLKTSVYSYETEISFIFQDKYEKWGFFDKESSFLQIPIYDYIIDRNGYDPNMPILVCNDGLWGYANRQTGRIIIPCQYTTISEFPEFKDGYALAADEFHNEDGDIWEEYELIDTLGNAVQYPKEVMPVSGVFQQRVIIENRESEKEGIADTQGSILCYPQYDIITPYLNDYASVKKGHLWGHIDLNGQEKVAPCFEIDDDWGDTGYQFDENHIARIRLIDKSVICIRVTVSNNR